MLPESQPPGVGIGGPGGIGGLDQLAALEPGQRQRTGHHDQRHRLRRLRHRQSRGCLARHRLQVLGVGIDTQQDQRDSGVPLVAKPRLLLDGPRGQLVKAADAARGADASARRLGFGQHFFAVDYLRALAGLALERRDLDTAERLTERALSITEQHWPALEFLTLLDRAQLWAARGQIHDALDTVKAARRVLAGARSVLQARADALEALLRLSLGDLRAPADLAGGLPPGRRSLLLARIALGTGDHRAAQEHLQSRSLDDLTPRQVLVRQILLAATAIERGDPSAGGILGGAVHLARQQGYLNTVVTAAPQVTSYLIEHAALLRPDPFADQLTAAAREVRAAQPGAGQLRSVLTEPLTATEQRILKLLPTSTYLQIADTLYVSRNTVKTHLRSIYQKLGVASRSEALERAVDLRLL